MINSFIQELDARAGNVELSNQQIVFSGQGDPARTILRRPDNRTLINRHRFKLTDNSARTRDLFRSGMALRAAYSGDNLYFRFVGTASRPAVEGANVVAPLIELLIINSRTRAQWRG